MNYAFQTKKKIEEYKVFLFVLILILWSTLYYTRCAVLQLARLSCCHVAFSKGPYSWTGIPVLSGFPCTAYEDRTKCGESWIKET